MPRLVQFSGGLEDWLSDQQRVLGRWRIKFINTIWVVQDTLGEFIKRLAKSYALNHWFDTGTLRKRIDYKVLRWNSIVFGIFEPDSEYYDPAQHYPTDDFMSKYSGWQPSPTTKHYAEFINTKDPFLDRIVDSIYNQQITKAVNDFMKDNPIV